MIEDKSLRTYKSNTYIIGWVEKKTVVWAWVRHYNNKLWLWDWESGFRKIDHILVDKWDYWTFEYNNFHPVLPKYADDEISFRDVWEAHREGKGHWTTTISGKAFPRNRDKIKKIYKCGNVFAEFV